MATPTTFIVTAPNGQRFLNLNGRVAWTLGLLSEAGPRGITAAELPAGVRLSAYIEKLRRLHGLSIRTEMAKAGGAYGGSFGRYVLDDPVLPVEEGAP